MAAHQRSAGARGGVIAIALAAAAALAGGAHAGTVDVLVRERGGSALRDEWVKLARLRSDPSRASDDLRWGGRIERAGADGHARFEGVAAGAYVADVPEPHDSRLLTLDADPFRRPTLAVVRNGDDVVHCTVELTRGTPVRVIVDSNTDEWQAAAIHCRHAETGREVVATIREAQGRADLALAPGRWTVTLDPPSGFVIVGVQRDGWPLDRCEARVDAVDWSAPVEVVWSIAGLAHAGGHSTAGVGCVAVRARLLAPGDAVRAAAARGCHTETEIVAMPDPKRCTWTMILPDGTWRFEQVLPDGFTPSPPFTDVIIAPGAQASVDLDAVPADKQRDKPKTFSAVVRVEAPDGRPVDGATIRAWPADVTSGAGEPLRTGETWNGQARFRGLAAQRLRFVASHPAFLDADAVADEWELPDEDLLAPEDAERLAVHVKLVSGARVTGTAVDAEGAPAGNVGITLVATGDPPLATVLAGHAEAWRRQAALTGTDGAFKLAPLWDGPHELSGTLWDGRATTCVVEVRVAGGEWAAKAALDLSLGEETKVELRVRTAASLDVPLLCNERGQLPPVTDVRLVAPFPPDVVPVVDDLLKSAIFARDELVLRGERRDTVAVGPIEAGSWLLAVRPFGFARWTWSPGTEDPANAIALRVLTGDPTALPPLAVDCDPLVVLEARVPAGSPLPDMRLADVTATWRPLDPEHRRQDPGGKLQPKRRIDSVELRGLRSGKVAIEARLTHPHALPGDQLTVRRDVEARDGGLVTLAVDFAGVGGSIEVAGSGRIARATAPDGSVRAADVADGRALLAHLPAGAYRVELCADAACESVVARWDAVVEPAHSLVLKAP